MDVKNLRLDEFIDRMGQDSGFKVQGYHRELLKRLNGGTRIITQWPRLGKKWMMEKQIHLQFWTVLTKLLEHFNSIHPWDKSIIQQLLKGGMTKEEIKQFRDLTLKASKAYYGKRN